MKKISKTVLALLLVLVLSISILPGVKLTANAATVNYKYNGSYVYNWGTRDEIATFLSPKAEAFYTGSNTYATWSQLEGSTSTANVPNSALYKALGSFMKSKHSKTTSYNATRYLFALTDCENNSTSAISSFYSGVSIGPDWDTGETWNREHTWPNSKSDSGSGGNGGSIRETDIIMLRPTACSENGSRSNTAYGEGGSYYDPNGLGQKVRGDVARIVLYVYTRWGYDTANADGVLKYMWGAGGVIANVNTLLKWMEEDPVDTWEMGRNDSCQTITGTRNVFVDYPELAFILFGEAVPAGYITPSGSDANASYTVTATSADPAKGTVSVSGRVITATPAAGYKASGYTLLDGTASVTQKGNQFIVSPSSNVTVQIQFTKKPIMPTATKLTSLPTSGDVIAVYNSNKVLGNASSGNKLAGVGATPEGNTLELTEEMAQLTVATEGNYYIFTMDGKYLTSDTAGNGLSFADTLTDCGRWTISSAGNGTWYITNVGAAYNGKHNQALEYYNGFTTYGNQNTDIFRMQLFKVHAQQSHSHTYAKKVTAPTCTAKGYTTYTCACGDSYKDTYVAAKGHSFGAWQTTKAATCTAAGSKRRDCSRCDHYETGTIAAKGHSYTKKVTAPTCTAKGYTTYTCACGSSYKDTYVAALGHIMSQWGTAEKATCTKTGTKRRDCARCNYCETGTIAATGHSYTSKVVKPTPAKQGYTQHTCACGASYKDKYVAVLNMSAPKVSIAVNATTGKPNLSWKYGGEGVTYEIYRATKKSGKYTKVGTVAAGSWTDSSASVGKTYYYKVKATYPQDTSYNSGFSSIVSAKPKCATPTLAVKTNSSGKPVLSWNKITGAKKYEIWRSVNGGKFKKVTTTTKLTYTDKKATSGAQCTYKIKALGSKSAYHSQFSQTDSCYVTCAAPTGIKVKVNTTTGKPTVSWKKVSGASGYAIYRSENGGSYQLLKKVTSVSYTDTGARAGVKYSYKVVALGKVAACNSTDSKVVTATATCAQPKITGKIGTAKKPQVSWKAVEGATKYVVYRSTKKSKGYKAVGTVTTDLTFTDTGAKKGKTYYYKVVAVSGAVSSAQSKYVKLKSK